MAKISILMLAALLAMFVVFGCTSDASDESADTSDQTTDVDSDESHMMEDGEMMDGDDHSDHAEGDESDADGDETASTMGEMTLAVYKNDNNEIICPVAGDVTTEETAVGHQDYEGMRYYFCCGGCPESFAADPAKYAVK